MQAAAVDLRSESKTPTEVAGVLVVDDDPAHLLLMQAALRPLDLPVTAVQSAEQALAELDRRPYSVALIDLLMPNIDGFDLAREIRVRSDGLPIVFVSSMIFSVRRIQRAYSLGAVDVITKPFVAEVLRAKVAAFAELSERRRQAQQRAEDLALANARLEQANHDLDEYAYVATHDLKEPLRGISNYATWLLKGPGQAMEGEARRKMEALPRLARHAQDLIQALYEYSQVSTGPIARNWVDVEEVVDEVIETLGLSKGPFEIEVQRPLPSIFCDRAGLQAILQNLIGNALKYNDSAKKRVAIQADSETTPTSFLVEDNGIGIAPDQHQTIFQMFKRLHPQDRYQGGTGAGLAIVRKVIERHEGQIQVESRTGTGTRFRFDLGADSTP